MCVSRLHGHLLRLYMGCQHTGVPHLPAEQTRQQGQSQEGRGHHRPSGTKL